LGVGADFDAGRSVGGFSRGSTVGESFRINLSEPREDFDGGLSGQAKGLNTPATPWNSSPERGEKGEQHERAKGKG